LAQCLHRGNRVAVNHIREHQLDTTRQSSQHRCRRTAGRSVCVPAGWERGLDTEPVRGSFGSLKGIISLFKSPRVILAGWVHFLAFDLMVALWIHSDAGPLAISHWWLIPIYLLTLMFGPAGWLVYLVVKITVA
jgi:Domain of unknown function (DUF4281)